ARPPSPAPAYSCSCPQIPEFAAQRLHGTKIMRFYASFRAFHRLRRLRDVQALKIAQQECLSLSVWQRCERLLEGSQDLIGFEQCARRGSRVDGLGDRIARRL